MSEFEILVMSTLAQMVSAGGCGTEAGLQALRKGMRKAYDLNTSHDACVKDKSPEIGAGRNCSAFTHFQADDEHDPW